MGSQARRLSPEPHARHRQSSAGRHDRGARLATTGARLATTCPPLPPSPQPEPGSPQPEPGSPQPAPPSPQLEVLLHNVPHVVHSELPLWRWDGRSTGRPKSANRQNRGHAGCRHSRPPALDQRHWPFDVASRLQKASDVDHECQPVAFVRPVTGSAIVQHGRFPAAASAWTFRQPQAPGDPGSRERLEIPAPPTAGPGRRHPGNRKRPGKGSSMCATDHQQHEPWAAGVSVWRGATRRRGTRWRRSGCACWWGLFPGPRHHQPVLPERY